MDPDYRAMLSAVLARTAQLIVEVEAIMRESTSSETVDRAITATRPVAAPHGRH